MINGTVKFLYQKPISQLYITKRVVWSKMKLSFLINDNSLRTTGVDSSVLLSHRLFRPGKK